MGGGRGWVPEDDRGNLGSDAGGKLGVAGDGDGVLPFRRSRLDPPMWLEWFDPGWLPVVEGWDILPRGRRKRWSSSSLPPSRAKLRVGGGSMVTAVATHLSLLAQSLSPRLVVLNHWLDENRAPHFFFFMLSRPSRHLFASPPCI